MKDHHYKVAVDWTGNKGDGTKTYTSYSRDHELSFEGKPVLNGSSDPAFRGDRARYNPEELLVASISACHMLWYLHLCASNGVVVTKYRDDASGTMAEGKGGEGQFTEAVLRPHVTITKESDAEKARSLHEEAHRLCFIARSVNFPVRNEPEIVKEAEKELQI